MQRIDGWRGGANVDSRRLCAFRFLEIEFPAKEKGRDRSSLSLSEETLECVRVCVCLREGCDGGLGPGRGGSARC